MNRWIVLWLVGAVVLILGAATLYFGPAWFLGGKGRGFYLPPQAWPALLITGVLALAAGAVGASRTVARPAESASQQGGTRFANVGPIFGLVAAAAALVAVVIVFAAPSIVQMSAADPCAQAAYSPSCFSAHPEYYQSTDGGYRWTTPSSRVGEAIGPLFLVAWPVALAGALISVMALATGTARRRTAIASLTIGSVVAIGQVLMELGLMLGLGGGD